MLVVEAREIGRGRLLAVEPDVLDRDRAASEAIFLDGMQLKLRDRPRLTTVMKRRITNTTNTRSSLVRQGREI